MSAKNYVMSFSAMLLIFMAGNVLLWNAVTRDYFIAGEFERMGSFKIYEAEGRDIVFPKKHTEFSDYIRRGIKESFDVITIGDSFSNGGGGNYYQDYLESEYGVKVLNVHIVYHCLKDLYMLIDSGLLDEISPRAVILESVERLVQLRLGASFVTPESADRNEIIHRVLSNTGRKIEAGYFAPIMTEANKNYIFNKLYHILNPERLSPEAYITELDRGLFTNKGQENLLLHYYEDMNFIESPLNSETVSKNLSNAAAILKKKGIKLIFFAAPDKYDLYYPYIKNKEGKPENKFFDELRKIRPEGYTIIDTLALLRSALERGEKDVYWLSDTHWSWKGIKIVADEIAKYLRP